jgi:hypothetical protein
MWRQINHLKINTETLQPTDLAKPDEPWRLMGTRLSLDHLEAAVEVILQVWNQNASFFWSEQRTLAGHPDLLLILGNTTGLHSEHCKYSELWNPWHPFWSTPDIQQAQLYDQEMKI